MSDHNFVLVETTLGCADNTGNVPEAMQEDIGFSTFIYFMKGQTGKVLMIS